MSYVEPCALGWESGSVKVERSGRVTAITGSSAHGQGHETTFAQVVADALGVTPEDVTVVHGDTRRGPEGFGTHGSRSTALGGGALVEAAVVVRDKGRRIAAKLLEAGVEDVVGGPRRLSCDRRAAEAGRVEGGRRGRLRRRRRAAGRRDARARGVALLPARGRGVELRRRGVAVVSIERETGRLVIESLVWVDDAGTIINPLLAEGQLHGGLAQGLGQALMEQIVYDERGQLLTATLMDYAIPRADEVPPVTIEKMHTPSTAQPARRQGPGRGRLHRHPAGARQRDGRRAGAVRGDPRGHAPDAGEALAGHAALSR